VLYAGIYISMLMLVDVFDPIITFRLGWAMIIVVVFNILSNMVLVFLDLYRATKKSWKKKMDEIRRWDSRGVKVCNCKCVHCGTKYESANREMAEVKTLAIKVVKCEQPVEPIM